MDLSNELTGDAGDLEQQLKSASQIMPLLVEAMVVATQRESLPTQLDLAATLLLNHADHEDAVTAAVIELVRGVANRLRAYQLPAQHL